MKVVDRRGEEKLEAVTPREQRVVEEARKPKPIKMRRCPNGSCRKNRPEDEYLFMPQFSLYVCRECGVLHMDTKLADHVYELSYQKGQGVNVKRKQ